MSAMYLTNKYTRWYYNIIQRAQTRSISGYTEQHHIIPRSLGGNNTKDNLVALTAREHFVCHLLLTKMTVNLFKQKMCFAFWLLCNNANKHQQRYKATSNTYAKIRNEYSKIVSLKYRGVSKGYASFAGKKHSVETKKLQSEVKKGSLNPNFGKKHSTDTKMKIGLTHKGIPKPKYVCEHCKKTVGGYNNFLRWHSDNCKGKKIL
jgi:hypothetical protein